MEPAIEQLLAMEVPDTSPAPPLEAQPPHRPQESRMTPHRQQAQAAPQSRWRNQLPDDFLRIPGVGLPPLGG